MTPEFEPPLRTKSDATDIPMVGPSPQVGLVLGAGGHVGIAYHGAVLSGLLEGCGFDPDSADLIIGTSAGAIVGADVRVGRTPAEICDISLRRHELQTNEGLGPRSAVMSRSWGSNPFHLIRRVLGSSYVVGRTIAPGKAPAAPQFLRKIFPAGYLAPELETADLRLLFDDEWPAGPLWLNAVHLKTGQREVLGRGGSLPATLQEAVLASAAIPGLFQPVRVAGRTLVDGGMHSATNLDLAATAGCRLIIGIAPMSYDAADPPSGHHRLVRGPMQNALASEVVFARGRGCDVLLIRPDAEIVDLMGLNPMREDGNEELMEATYHKAVAMARSDRFRRLLAPYEMVS